METLKFHNNNSRQLIKNMATSDNNNHDSDVESLLLSQCWNQNPTSELTNEYLLDSQKLIIDNSITDITSDKYDAGCSDTEISAKATIDLYDNLILSSSSLNTNLAELKPLPPFTGYTGHLNINGIQGHHYHAIAQQRIPEENNNNTYSSYSNEHNIVSSSTCIGNDNRHLADSRADSSVKMYSIDDGESLGIKLEYNDCMVSDSAVTNVKNELVGEYDISSIEDIAAIIGSAIADTTVPNNNSLDDDQNASRDSWMDLDAWIDGACVDNSTQKSIIISSDSLSEYILPHSSPSTQTTHTSEYTCAKSQLMQEYSGKSICQQTVIQNQQNHNSNMQNILPHTYMPLLQSRLQNGPPGKNEMPSSTSYGLELISTSSPPGNVVSTTDNILLNGRYIQQSHYGMMGMSDDHHRDQNYPHTTTTTPTVTKKSRSKSHKKHQQASSSTMFAPDQTLALLGKEKPMHRCNICQRGFLNKSNIKVHLRTHTGEKPFRCETCAKAFRQKAHLIKHQQIHKRIGRD